jgi:hypothetical protein
VEGHHTGDAGADRPVRSAPRREFAGDEKAGHGGDLVA